MRVLTVPPTSEGWVALPPSWSITPLGILFDTTSVTVVLTPDSPRPVLGLVEPCDVCGGHYCLNDVCIDDACELVHFCPDDDDGRHTGHLLVGFVRVVAVRPVYLLATVLDHGLPVEWLPHVVLTERGVAIYCKRDERYPDEWDEQVIDLPNAVPGGVAIKVEPCECPTCNGRGFTFAGPMLRGGPICPTCSDLPRPVALTGDAPIQELSDAPDGVQP